jgi:hypothetical protein
VSRRLSDIADEIGRPHDVSKARAWHELYDRCSEEFADLPVTLMELGVYTGESAKVFASYFKRGKNIGVDFEDLGTDFSGFPNVVFAAADQRDANRLNAICAANATWAAIRPTRGAPRTHAPKWEFMNIHPEMVVLKKALP